MKKLFTFLIGVVLITSFSTTTFSQTEVSDLKEDFLSDVGNWGFTLNNGGTQTISYNSTNKLLQVRWPNSSSEYLKTLATSITPGTDNKITVEFIIKAYTSGSSSNFGALYLLDDAGNAITGFYVRRQNIGGSNKWAIGRATSYVGTTYSYPTSTDGLNADQPTARIVFVLDFNAKTLSFTADQGSFDYNTRIFTAAGSTVTSSNQAFINASASNIKTFSSWYYRASSTTGTNGYDLMYAEISALRYVPTADVTVKFKDQFDNYFLTDEVIADQVQSSTYSATFEQKKSKKVGDYYYVLNPTSPTSVVVNPGGSTLTLQFTRAPYYSQMIWNGTTGENTNIWSELYANFKNGDTPTAYQKDANLTFSPDAENKSVAVNENLLMGSSSVYITGGDYNFTGAGSLNGTGSFNINLDGAAALALGVTNNLTGGTIIQGGSITVNKTGALGASATINGGTNIISNANLPVLNINSNTVINANTSTAISGLSVPAGVTLNVVSALNTVNAVHGATFAPVGTYEGELALSGDNTDVRFGMTSASSTFLANAKVNLMGSAMLFIDVNQGGATTINIGKLSGETGSKLGWGRSSDLNRTITWSVGALNENSEYAGTITNLGGYNTGGAFYTGNMTNFIKEGTGVLTMSGTANTHNGNFTINNGTINVTGAIGNATSIITVGANGTLKGTGTIGGATTVNGTLEGSLNFGSSLTLNGTTKFVVNGVNEGEFDKINVTGAANVGGTIDVTVNIVSGVKGVDKIRNANPPIGTRIKLINAGSIVTSLPTVHYSSNGWTFIPATGELVYDPNNVVSGINSNVVPFSIYPTLTRDIVNVEGNVKTIDVFSLTGQRVNSLVANGTKTAVNMSNLSSGAYIIRANMEDGSANMQNVILQK